MGVVPAGVVAVPFPDLAILLEQRLAVRGLRKQRGVIAVARGELDRLAVAAGKPERRIRLLQRFVVQLDVAVVVVPALEIEHLVFTRCKEYLERFTVALARFLDAFHVEDQRFDRRHAASYAELEAPARELVEHADLVVEAEGVVPGQAEGERPQAQPPRALDHRRQQHARRAVDGKRRALVLGDEIGVQAGLVGGGGELELVHRAGRALGRLDPVENAELQIGHRHTWRAVSTTRSSLRFWSSSLMRLPTTSEPKPHCGLSARFSSGTYWAACT